MVDLINDIETNLESKQLNNEEDTQDISKYDDSANKQDNLIDTNSFSDTDNDVKLQSSEISNLSATEENQEVVNCLALTVKKDYNLSIVKNVVVKTFKNIWKVALSIFTLNFLKFFL